MWKGAKINALLLPVCMKERVVCTWESILFVLSFLIEISSYGDTSGPSSRSTSSFHLPELVQVSMDELVSGFHIKTSPSFKAKLGFIGLLNPESALTLADSFFFFLMTLRASGEILWNAPSFIRHRVGRKKVRPSEQSFYSRLTRSCRPWSFQIQGDLSCHLLVKRAPNFYPNISDGFFCPFVFYFKIFFQIRK